MASVLYTAPIDELRGSIGALTFTRNAAGAIARVRTKPTRSPSVLLADQHALLSTWAFMWHNEVTQQNRDDWDTLGAATTWTNPLGITYHPTGRNLFCRCAAVSDVANYPIPYDPPQDADEADPGFTFAYDGARYIRLTAIGTLSDPPTGRVYYYVSGPSRPAPKTHTHPWSFYFRTFIAAIAPPQNTWYDLGAVHPEGRFWIRMRVYRRDTVPPFTQRGRCTANIYHQVHYAAAP